MKLGTRFIQFTSCMHLREKQTFSIMENELRYCKYGLCQLNRKVLARSQVTTDQNYYDLWEEAHSSRHSATAEL